MPTQAAAERARLDTLRSFEILDTDPDEDFDTIARLVAGILEELGCDAIEGHFISRPLRPADASAFRLKKRTS